MNYEKGFVTPKGSKSCRYADTVEIVDGNIVAIHQVGKVNKTEQLRFENRRLLKISRTHLIMMEHQFTFDPTILTLDPLYMIFRKQRNDLWENKLIFT